jgi:hypothetical protein
MPLKTLIIHGNDFTTAGCSGASCYSRLSNTGTDTDLSRIEHPLPHGPTRQSTPLVRGPTSQETSSIRRSPFSIPLLSLGFISPADDF